MRLPNKALNLLTGGDYERQQTAVRDVIRSFREASNWLQQRAQEDAGWQKLADDTTGEGIELAKKIAWSRSMFKRDPFAKRMVFSKTEFCFCSGIDGPRGKRKPRTEGDDGQQQNPALQLLMDFWNDQGNQAAMFKAPMQVQRSNQLQLDGNLFLKLFVPASGPVRVRRYGTLLVNRIITDPNDASRPLYYASKIAEMQWDAGEAELEPTGQAKWEYYRDINNTNPAEDPLHGLIPAEDDVYMMHVTMNCTDDGGFGEPELITSLKWLQANKAIAEDQATISRATAALMNMLSAETTDEGALDSLARSLRSVTDADPDTPLAGSVNVLSEGLDLKTGRASTNAGDAWQNGRMMRMAAGVGGGLPMHFMGDPENANLATSKSMELPTLKCLETYQTLWRSVYGDLFNFALLQAGYNPADVDYDIPMPHFVEEDIEAVAATVFDALDRGLLTEDQAAQRIMELLKLDDIPARLEELLSNKAAREKQDVDDTAALLAARDAEDDDPPQVDDDAA